MPDWLKTGDWLDAARVRRVALMVALLSLAGLVAMIATSDGMKDFRGRPLGTDFSNVYAAGRMALEGRAADAYDWTAHHTVQKQVFADPDIPFYGWHYPPFFLMAAALLALLPYTAALAAWMAATMPLYIAAMRAIQPGRGALLVALAFPAVFVNLTHGQNGFLTGALIGAALLLLDRRPALAGVFIGLLAYKPQFGVLIPLALLASGRWKTFNAAASTVLILAAVATALFGEEIWRAFIASGEPTRTIVLESGNTGWEKIQSLFAALRAVGAPISAAYAAQGALFLGLAASIVWLWRGEAPQPVKNAGLIVASLLATPYVMDYDLMALAPAMAFLVGQGQSGGFRPYEKSALALAFIAPLIARPIADATYIPLGLIAMLGLYAVIVARAYASSAATHGGAPLRLSSTLSRQSRRS